MGIGTLCDHDYCIPLDKTTVMVFSKDNAVLLRGHRNATGARIRRLSICPHDHTAAPTQWQSGPINLNYNYLPSVGALVRYIHAAAVFLVKSTWLAAIKTVNYASWPGLTYTNMYNYCPVSINILQCHIKK